jgi:uncharacterized membrane protein (UPF0127 family)
MKPLRVLVFLLFSAIIMDAAYARDQMPVGSPQPELPKEALSVLTQHGEHSFRVEVARDAEALRRGLMFRTELPAHTGMLFGFPRQQRVSMWMKDTLISLDMLFIDASGAITDIAARTTPRRSTSHAACTCAPTLGPR